MKKHLLYRILLGTNIQRCFFLGEQNWIISAIGGEGSMADEGRTTRSIEQKL